MNKLLGFATIRRQIEQNATQFVLLVALATMPIAIVTGWLLASAWQQSSLEQAMTQAERNANTTLLEVSKAVDKQFTQYMGLARVVSSLPEIRDYFTRQSASEALNAYLNSFALNVGVDYVFVTDLNGSVLLTSNSGSPSDLTGQDFSEHEHIRAAQDGIASFEFRIGAPNDEAGFYFSTPILDTNNQLLGTATLKLNQQTLAEIIPQKGVIIADERGMVVLSDRKHLTLRALSNAEALNFPKPLLLELYQRDTINTVEPLSGSHIGDFKPKFYWFADQFDEQVPHLVTSSSVRINDNLVEIHAYEPFSAYTRLEREKPVAAAFLVLGFSTLWWALSASIVYTLRARWYRQELLVSNAQLEAVNEELSNMALHDPLTGCANRRGLNHRLNEEMDRAVRYGRPLSAAIIDIDYFKNLNDKFGHQAGDQALKRLVELVQPRLRNTDFLARAGGEEFVILMPETSLEAAEFVLERIREVVANESFFSDRGVINMTISIGVACIASGETGDELIERADVQLYRAKSEGRNRVCS